MTKRNVNDLITWSPSHLITSAKRGFTLAEVLITLAIIGIVAAMTIPTLISNHKKKTVETRLAKFYSTMTQAMQLSTVKNGYYTTWENLENQRIEREDGSAYYYTANALEWFNKYLISYLKISKIEEVANSEEGKVAVYFPDGSLMLFSASSFVFYPYAQDYEKSIVDEESGLVGRNRDVSGINYFTFSFSSNSEWLKGNGFMPYLSGYWDGTREDLLNDPIVGCNENAEVERAFCTKLIQMNNWKIPDDYPFKF